MLDTRRESGGRLSYRSFRRGLIIQLSERLFAGFEWKWVGELYCDSTQAVGERVNPADGAGTDELTNVEPFIRVIERHAEARGYALARAGAALVCKTSKCRPSAANIHHLTL